MELAAQGDFNFFKYIPNDPDHSFTPLMLHWAWGIFYLRSLRLPGWRKDFPSPLGTEGQVGGYLGRKEYNTMAICIPFGVGIKYSLSQKTNLTFEISNRFTTTDYLDDVSTTYAPVLIFLMDLPARLLLTWCRTALMRSTPIICWATRRGANADGGNATNMWSPKWAYLSI